MKKGRPKSNITASNQYLWLILCNSEWYKLDFAWAITLIMPLNCSIGTLVRGQISTKL